MALQFCRSRLADESENRSKTSENSVKKSLPAATAVHDVDGATVERHRRSYGRRLCDISWRQVIGQHHLDVHSVIVKPQKTRTDREFKITAGKKSKKEKRNNPNARKLKDIQMK